MPLVVAIMLSLLLAPMVRVLTRVGLPRLPSVFLAVLAFTGTCVAGALVLGTQVLRIAQSIPQYQVVVERKLQTVNAVTEGRLTLLTDQAKRLLEGRDPTGTITQLTAPVTHAAQTIGIVLLVLVFALLEYESLRDRFIRLVGAADIHKATLALDDAGQRLSRFFVSQFVVNLSFGLAVGLGLAILQVPQAMLLGTLAGVMRFVPYVGVGIAALLSTVLALIVEPGWSLAAATLGVFVLLDVIVGQLLEPHLYGHATGLSPLAVVVAAIFWSSIWGPVGLILSTP